MANASESLQPQKDALALTQLSLRKNQERIEQMYTMMDSSEINESLLTIE